MYYVYFILLDSTYVYKGYTSDLKRRWKEHLSNKVSYTKRYSNKVLIGYESYICESEARRRERFLKTTEEGSVFRQQYRDILVKNSYQGNFIEEEIEN